MKSNKKKSNNRKTKSRSSIKLFLKSIPMPAVIIFGVLLTGAVLISVNLISSQLQKHAPKLATPGVWQSFKATDDNFLADFPATPTEHTASFSADGFTVPIKMYEYSDTNARVSYVIEDADMSGIYKQASDEEISSTLEGAIRSTAANSNATIVAKSKDTDFRGYKARKATLEIKDQNQTFRIYAIAFYSDQHMYMILVGGEAEEIFNSFVNSFEFY